MKFYKELWRNKLVLSLIAVVIILLILSIIFPISLFQNLTTQLSIITALILPFIIKGIESKDKEKDEKDIVIHIIKRIKDYLKYILSGKHIGEYHGFSSSMPFFHFISQKFPEILIKIGIEINLREEEIGFYEKKKKYRPSELFILDKYFLEVHPTCRLILIEDNKDITPNKKEFENILGELINHINNVFPFKLSKDLARFD